MNKRTMTKRFYIGSARMSNGEAEARGWLKTFGEALEGAKELVQNGNDEVRYVVEIVAVIRKKETPVIVEMIRK